VLTPEEYAPDKQRDALPEVQGDKGARSAADAATVTGN